MLNPPDFSIFKDFNDFCNQMNFTSSQGLEYLSNFLGERKNYDDKLRVYTKP